MAPGLVPQQACLRQCSSTVPISSGPKPLQATSSVVGEVMILRAPRLARTVLK